MSNEWSSSVATIGEVNHQWSKSYEFEAAFQALTPVRYFSRLRPYTELFIAQRFAQYPQYFSTFRSCNRAFHIDPARRLDHWCGQCDKCAFIDLILSPFVSADDLDGVFAGNEPLRNPALIDQFRALIGRLPDAKPWECVGDEQECRAAAVLAAHRPDRAEHKLVQQLAQEAQPAPNPDDLLKPIGPHFIPEAYASADLLG